MISVVMASYLGDYPNSVDNKDKRFIFSVNSFLKQTNNNSQLIIISDGCDSTEKIWEKEFKRENRIKFYKVKRTCLFGGTPRNKGIDIADGEIICYLDSDDFIGPLHLKIIEENFTEEIDWCFYNDYVFTGHNFFRKRNVNLDKMVIGTCSIAHKKDLDIRWENGYGHDHKIINNMINKGYRFKKIKIPQYFVCHVPIPGNYFDINKENYSFEP